MDVHPPKNGIFIGIDPYTTNYGFPIELVTGANLNQLISNGGLTL